MSTSLNLDSLIGANLHDSCSHGDRRITEGVLKHVAATETHNNVTRMYGNYSKNQPPMGDPHNLQ